MQPWQSRVVVTQAYDLESLKYLLFSLLPKKRKSPIPRLDAYLMLPDVISNAWCLWMFVFHFSPGPAQGGGLGNHAYLHDKMGA